MSLLKSWSLVVAAARRIHSPALPLNIQELSSSQTREVASSQAARSQCMVSLSSFSSQLFIYSESSALASSLTRATS